MQYRCVAVAAISVALASSPMRVSSATLEPPADDRHLLVLVVADADSYRVQHVVVVAAPLPARRANFQGRSGHWEFGVVTAAGEWQRLGHLPDPTWVSGEQLGVVPGQLQAVRGKRAGPVTFAVRLPYVTSGTLWLRRVVDPAESKAASQAPFAVLPFVVAP